MVTLRQLRYLVALRQHGHFGRAAEACAVTQPALSMQIRALERDLGAPLVERRPGQAVLTETGREIAARAETILAAARDLGDFARHRDVLTGPLRLGIIPTLAPYLLPRLLPPLQRDHPGLRLEMRETQTEMLRAELRRGELDAVMVALPFEDSDVESVRVFEDPFLLAVPAGDRLAAATRIGVQDVDQSRLILLEEGHCLRDQALAFCGAAARGAAAGLGATSLTTVMQMVANGYGVTLVPKVAVDVEVRDGRIKLLRFGRPEPIRTIGLAWRRTSSRKADFVALARIAAGTLRSRPDHNSASRSSAARFSRQ